MCGGLLDLGLFYFIFLNSNKKHIFIITFLIYLNQDALWLMYWGEYFLSLMISGCVEGVYVCTCFPLHLLLCLLVAFQDLHFEYGPNIGTGRPAQSLSN